ncbi:M14 family metallopeptidase [Flavobacterium selenitireducens]|uniref:M14 family metallopeptidase n=1 Tax=Flavobacterium selenitireducens TaxID=2722704 RepID=UPI00168ABE4B|nr:M14 metallopeptidase family protein [Flavobacterium selenitireducens]MBD3581062.1 peptidase M14 [Flavobacterium selenitireducens]
MEYRELFDACKENAISGRYVTLDDILPLLKQHSSHGMVKSVGNSVNGLPLLSYKVGSGPRRILLWSQMHGNETTATKALFDVFNFLCGKSEPARKLLSEFTFCFVPMLNPDGAKAYTRENAAGIDLNRDFHELTQPESRALVELFEEFEPEICYNLHDQRTIFGVGDTGRPATISFLSPAFNHNCDMNACRQKAVEVIVGMNAVLQALIPGQVGRFDDSFNINCVGDNFQFRGIPTVLIEAGHYPSDYQREQTRFYFFVSLLSGFQYLSENDIVANAIDDYLNIPQNKTVFFDFVYRNVNVNYDGIEKNTNFAAQYKEELVGKTIGFDAYIVQVGNLENHYGHIEINADGRIFRNDAHNFPEIGQKANFYLGNDVKIVNGLKKM